MSACIFCDEKYYPSQKWDYEKERHRDIVPGGWGRLVAGVDKKNRAFLYGSGDDDSARYYPKFCPECGKKLRDFTQDEVGEYRYRYPE